MRPPARLLVPLTALALAAGAAPSFADRPSDLPVRQNHDARPFDYVAQAPRLSQPVYGAAEIEKLVVPVEAFDGETLYVEVTKPKGVQDLPVVLEASPYHGTVADREGTRIFPDPTAADGSKIGLTGYFASRGYAVAIMDLRGTGRSTGCLDHLGPKDGKDLKTVVEALAKAPWSNGRVGMTGHSYVGSTPSLAAAMEPEGLETIVPSAGLASMYDHQFQMGVPYNLQYIGPMVAYEGLALSRDLPGFLPAVPVIGGPNGDNFDQNGPNAQTGCGLTQSAALAGTGQVTGQYELWHAQRDSSKGAAAADIPVFMIHGANDNAARIPAAEWFFGQRYGRPGDKVWLGQWDHGSTNGRCADTKGARTLHPTCRFDQFQEALHAWFDKHLMQKPGVDTGPAAEVFLNGTKPLPVTQLVDPEKVAGRGVVTSDSWARPTQRLALYPDARDGSLRFSKPDGAGSRSFSTGAQAVLAEVAAGQAEFVSAPLAEDTVFVGLADLNLVASLTGVAAHLTAELYRQDASGARELMNTCAIQPMLRDGVATLSPVVPLQAMDLPMQCFTVAQHVRAGQKLVLQVSGRSQHHASFLGDANVTVLTGPDATRYRLPTWDATVFDDVRLRQPGTVDGPRIVDAEGPSSGAAARTVSVPGPLQTLIAQ